jgi:hypothetical protein
LLAISRRKRRSLPWGMRSRYRPSPRANLPRTGLWLGKSERALISHFRLGKS